MNMQIMPFDWGVCPHSLAHPHDMYMDDIHYFKHGKDSKVYRKGDDGNLITSNQ